MKLEKKNVASALAVLCLGMAVFLASFHTDHAGVAGTTAGSVRTSVQISGDLSVDDVKFVEESGETRIDFDALKAQNPDIYAWITVPGTGIDYPVLQKGDAADPYDDYYLNHTLDLREGYPGSIYSHAVNQRDFEDPVTILYGHNLKDGSMFSGLHEFEDQEFFEKNHQILIHLPDRTVTYEVFAAVDYSDELLPCAYDFSSPGEVRRYLADVGSCAGNFREDMEVSEEDKILTLSTCYSGRDDRRLLIEAVMTESVQIR